MEDAQIVRLYFNRDESAIAETAAKYGDYCHSIAYGILRDAGDSEESVSDTWLGAWNSIPPHCPAGLAGFLGKITRRVSIDRLRRRGAEKRGGGELPLALEELERCIPGGGSAEQAVEARELEQAVNGFLSRLPETERRVFLCRYWYLDPIGEIAERFGFTGSKVTSMLHRTRKKLKKHLEKEGF